MAYEKGGLVPPFLMEKNAVPNNIFGSPR